MRIALVGLLGLSMFKGCDMGDPQSVQPKMEDALRPYFPKVKAVALPQQQTLVGLSCLENVGDEMIKMVPAAVGSNPAMSQLKLLRMLPGSSYSTVAVGFEQSLAVYNLETGVMGTAPMDANYATWYRQQCGLNQQAGSKNTHAWIGYFSGAIECDNGRKEIVYSLDTLGVWSEREYLDRHLASEIERMRDKWGGAWAKQHCTLSDIKLNSVRDVPVPISPPGN